MGLLVHPGEFENEVCEAAEVDEDGEDHANLVLPSSPECRHEQDEDRDRDGGDRQPVLSICQPGDDNQELDGEAEEEEKIKLQQSDVDLAGSALPNGVAVCCAYLEGQKSTLHTEVGTDVLVDCPGELIVQFPCNHRQRTGEEGYDAGHGHEVRLDVDPDGRADLNVTFGSQPINSLVDLIVLYRCIYQHAQIVDA